MSLGGESRKIVQLAFPLVIGQVSQMLLGVADTLMLGRLGVTALAVLTFTNSLFYLPFVFGIGVLTAVSVFTSIARGGEERADARASCRNGLYLGAVLGGVLFVLSYGLSFFLDRFQQPSEVIEQSRTFFRIIMFSMIPALMSMALKSHSDAMDRPWPGFWIFFLGVLLNIFLNWVLIFGNLGVVAMGIEGAAWATLISRTLILLAMFVWFANSRKLKEWIPYRWVRKPDWGVIRGLWAVGFPASIQMVCEVAAFSVSGLLMGRFGETAMASHQIALMCASTAFMVPLGLSLALSVRVGEVAGMKEEERLRAISLSGWLIGGGWALTSALVFLTGGPWLVSFFSQEPKVVQLAVQILVVVGFFQLVDSLQVISAAILRALHDVRVPAMIGFVSYWIVGMPAAVLLSFFAGMGPIGIWGGLALGLAVACLTLTNRVWKRVSVFRPA